MYAVEAIISQSYHIAVEDIMITFLRFVADLVKNILFKTKTSKSKN